MLEVVLRTTTQRPPLRLGSSPAKRSRGPEPNKLKSFAPKTGYNIRRSVSYLFHTPTPSSLHATFNDLKRSPPSQSRRHNLLLDVIVSPHNAKCEPSLPHTLSVCTSASPTAFILARKLASAQRRLTKSICVRSRECGWQICDV